jgi:hypothetical protein
MHTDVQLGSDLVGPVVSLGKESRLETHRKWRAFRRMLLTSLESISRKMHVYAKAARRPE